MEQNVNTGNYKQIGLTITFLLLIKLPVIISVMTPTPRANSDTKKFLFDHVWGLPCHHLKHSHKDIKKIQVMKGNKGIKVILF